MKSHQGICFLVLFGFFFFYFPLDSTKYTIKTYRLSKISNKKLLILLAYRLLIIIIGGVGTLGSEHCK